ncbi:MAG: arginine--tRNA ligase [Deltaproteobacteria bacterium]|nr:arginine--tRNA ligase [Deltaproteobacteria bacterium]
MKQLVENILKTTLCKLVTEAVLEASCLQNPIQIEVPSAKTHGDFSCNIAMALASRLKRKPREIAELLQKNIQDSEFSIEKIEIAGPGFLNFFLSPKAYQKSLEEILKHSTFLQVQVGQNQKVLLEYVSANPTGPMHIGHGRNAVVGDTLARLLSKTGYQVHKEFYVNDYGVQIKTLGNSVDYYLKKIFFPSQSLDAPPEGSYQGIYLQELVEAHAEEFKPFVGDIAKLGKAAGLHLLKKVKEDLASIDIHFDQYFSEFSLYEDDQISKVLDLLKSKGQIFEDQGAVWLKTTACGDDKDRVLKKSDGSYTYFTPDIAYHKNKFDRNFDLYINVWGADHGGYVPRIRAALQALGFDAAKLKVLLIQMVNLKRGAERVQMSKRSGTYVTLREVVDEVGSDATRFFFLLRSASAQLDFDLDLAQKQSSENPVFYIQYAHARIASILRKGQAEGFVGDEKYFSSLENIKLPEEFELIQKMSEYPEMLKKAALELEPHAVAFYLMDLAKLFQAYYSKAKQDVRYKVLSENKEASSAKLSLLFALRKVLRAGFEIVGISAPEEMHQNIESFS